MVSEVKHYRNTFDKKVKQFNHSFQLPDYFSEMIGDKKKVDIAEVGCALVNTIGDTWPGVDVHVACSDKHADAFNDLWVKHNETPLTPIEFQDMEAFTYDSDSFDIVHCRNALDHTEDALRVVEEMKRISKEWVYLLHAPNQRSTYGGHHYWDIRLEDGKTVLYGKEYSIVLHGFKSYLDDDGLIVSKYKHDVR